jgi:translation initiation factor IF-3
VKFNLRFRGREIFHQEIGMQILNQIAEELRDIVVVEQRPLMEGRVLSLLVAPNQKARTLARQQQAQRPAEGAQAAANRSVSDTNDDADDADDLDDIDDDEDETED